MIFAILVGVFLVLAYVLNKHLFSFWTKRGFKQLNPTFIVGDAAPLFQFKTSIGEYFQGLYNQYKEHKVLGIYMLYRPVLVVTDAKLVKDIMIRDFTSFHDRPMPVDEVNDPLSGKIVNEYFEKISNFNFPQHICSIFPVKSGEICVSNYLQHLPRENSRECFRS